MGQSNQPRWIWILLLLFFGSSIFSAVSFGLTAALGFPYEWGGALTLAMLGAVILLMVQRYGFLTYSLAACVGVILISALAIFRGVAIQKPNLPPDLAAYIESNEALTPYSALFGDYGGYGGYSAYDYTIAPSEDRAVLTDYIYFPEQRLALTIQFPLQDSLGGQWAFNSGEVRAGGALNGRFEADPANNWTTAEEADFDFRQDSQLANPYMVVALPIANAQTDREITLQAQLSIVLPREDGKTETLTLERQIGILVASPNFYGYQADYDNWQRARRVVETPLWIALIAASVASGAASVYLIRQGALQKVAASDFVMIVRKPSGLKSLGVEAHNLANVNVESELERGVMLGFVNAQSPAGRGGLRAGDVIIQFDDKPVKTPKDLDRLASRMKKGQLVAVKVLRNGEEVSERVRF